MAKEENYPTEEVEVAEDIRLAQLAGVAVGGLRRAVNHLRGLTSTAFSLDNLFPGERPEPLPIHADRPDIEAWRRNGVL